MSVVVVGAACSDDDDGGAEQDVEDAVAAFEKADNDVDIDAYMAITTPHFIDSFYGAMGVPKEALEQSPGDFLGSQPPLTVEKVDVDGDKATAIVSATAEATGAETWVEAHLLKQDDTWKVDELQTTEALTKPDGASTVEVGLQDFAFDFDSSQIKAGAPLVITGKNQGKQAHMIYLARIPEDANLEELLQSGEGTPPGVTDIADSFIWAPGDEGDVVVTKNLEAGRYVMLCFLPDTTDPDGTPHFMKGMQADFEVK